MALEDDIPFARELARREAEEQELVLPLDLADADEDLGGVGHSRVGLHLRKQALRKHRPGQVGRALLEEAEVGPADVDQLVRRLLHACGDREQRDDQPYADGDSGDGQARARLAPEEVLEHEPTPGHAVYPLRRRPACACSPDPTSYAALLRGVNLGARNRIAMADLRALIEELGGIDVRTYVQSGNVVFRSGLKAADLASSIESAIRERLGLEVVVLTRTDEQLRDVVAGNPFAGQSAGPKELQVTFLAEIPEPERVQSLAGRDFAPERFEIVEADVYLSCPDGYGRSKLGNAMFERELGVPATTRNWRTVTALAELVSAD